MEIEKAKNLSFVAISDVHLEFYNSSKFPKCLFEEYDCDTLVIAGDFGAPLNYNGKPNQHYVEILKLLKLHYKHIVYVSGNHEYYQCKQRDMSPMEMDFIIQKICDEIGIHFLQKSHWIHPETNVCFLGCTLWSDIDAEAAMTMNDFNKIFNFRHEYVQLFRDHSDWLMKTIQDFKHDFPIVVVTHHLPTFHGVAEKYAMQNNTGYASDLQCLFKRPVIALVCGHTHEPRIVYVNGIPLVINPVGYPGEKIDGKRNGIIEICL